MFLQIFQSLCSLTLEGTPTFGYLQGWLLLRTRRGARSGRRRGGALQALHFVDALLHTAALLLRYPDVGNLSYIFYYGINMYIYVWLYDVI